MTGSWLHLVWDSLSKSASRKHIKLQQVSVRIAVPGVMFMLLDLPNTKQECYWLKYDIPKYISYLF